MAFIRGELKILKFCSGAQVQGIFRPTRSGFKGLKPLKLSLLNNLAATKCLWEEYLSIISTHIQSHTSLASATSVCEEFSQYFEFLISKTTVLKFVIYSLILNKLISRDCIWL